MNRMNCLKVIKESKKTKNYLVTIAIGEKYYNEWFEYALPSWEKYCENYDLGIIVITHDLVDKDNKNWKKATWQKLLLGQTFIDNKLEVNNICYLDTDILINHYSPNVFNNYDEETIAVVSQRNNLPQPLDVTLRRLAFLRHSHYDKSYPLDSALFMTPEKVYEYHNLEPKSDYFCAGFFVFNVNNHSSIMKTWFDKYTKDIDTLTGGGDEPILNYEFLNYGKLSWLDYRFQALWIYETPWKYPFLYNYGKNDKNLIKECVEASLTSNYFLHFAGSWHESEMWKISGLFQTKEKQNLLKEYYEYLEVPVSGKPKGMIKPEKDKKNDG